VSEDKIQYTGLAGNYDLIKQSHFVHSSKHSAEGLSAGGAYAYSHAIKTGSKTGNPTGNTAAINKADDQTGKTTGRPNTASAKVGISASGGAGWSENEENVQSTWMDINGD